MRIISRCVIKSHDGNLSRHNVTYLLEQSGAMRTHIGRVLIFHQTPTNKWQYPVMKNTGIIKGWRNIYIQSFKRPCIHLYQEVQLTFGRAIIYPLLVLLVVP